MIIRFELSKKSLRRYFDHAQAWLWVPSRRPYCILGGVVLFVLFLVLTKPSGQSKEAPDPSHQIETLSVHLQPLATSLNLYGTIESTSKSTLVSTVNSSVAETPFKEGDLIVYGDTLLLLDPIEPQWVAQQRSADVQELEGLIATEINRHEANLKALAHEQELLALQKQALDRQIKLATQKLAAAANVDLARLEVLRLSLTVEARQLEIKDHQARLAQLESRLSKARAHHAQAELDLSRTRLVSPYSGRVAKLHVAPLDRVTPGTPLMDIYEHQALEIRTQIPTKYMTQVHQLIRSGKTVLGQAKIDGQTLNLELVRLSGEVQSGQGGVDALFKVLGDYPTLALGRPVNLSVALENDTPLIAIPYTALYGHDRIFKITDHVLQGVTVTRHGERLNDQGQAEILISSNELADNDLILTSLLPNATTGMKVNAN